MEDFHVSTQGIRFVTQTENYQDREGFLLTLCPFVEWNGLVQRLAVEGVTISERNLTKILLAENDTQVETKVGFIAIRPSFERVSPHRVISVFRDVDLQGMEYAIRFLLLSNPGRPPHMIMMETPICDRQQISEWAQDEMLRVPCDLTKLIGIQVLEHHHQYLESVDDQMGMVEEGILNEPAKWQQAKIIFLHKQIVGIKKSLNAHDAVFNRFAAQDKCEGGTSWQELLRDILKEMENARHTHELIESLREAYQTAIDNKANDIMKVLTLLATILLPINLVTSFFGMNFERMPLINHPYGITLFYGISAAIIVVVLLLFRRKRWLK